MRNTTRILCLVCSMIFIQNVSYSQQGNEPIEAVIKRAEASGIMRRDGYRLTYMAAPGQDTAKIRSYYADIIKKSGKPYFFQFQNKTVPVQANTDLRQPTNFTPQQPLEQVKTNVNPNPDQTMNNSSGNCYTRQSVFGELHYTDKIENYTWTVPDGITVIRIEAWSGGGNGFSELEYSNEVFSTGVKRLADISGGGGGGGAYASATLLVQKGDQVLISIPPAGGGKSVEILLNNKGNALYINNGGDGKADALYGKGMGGVSGGAYGKFADHVMWVSGQNGGILLGGTYSFDPGEMSDGLLRQTRPSTTDIRIDNFGSGGGAAFLSNGGRGASLHAQPFGLYANAQNGGFPGGGGGGGVSAGSGYDLGKGAPGMVIIHF